MKNWIVYILIGAGIAVYNVSMQADRDSSGAIVDAGNVGAFSLRTGDCFNNASYTFDAEPVRPTPVSAPEPALE